MAYLDPEDPRHARASEAFDEFGGRMIVTGAVITETMYFVSDDVDGARSLADLVLRGGLVVVDAFQRDDLRAAARLMTRYRDTPMDFADATLVLVGEALGVLDILTHDRRGFSTYRTSDGKPFRLVLDAA